MKPDDPAPDQRWDAGALGCGELVIGLRRTLLAMAPGALLELRARHGIPVSASAARP